MRNLLLRYFCFQLNGREWFKSIITGSFISDRVVNDSATQFDLKISINDLLSS